MNKYTMHTGSAELPLLFYSSQMYFLNTGPAAMKAPLLCPITLASQVLTAYGIHNHGVWGQKSPPYPTPCFLQGLIYAFKSLKLQRFCILIPCFGSIHISVTVLFIEIKANKKHVSFDRNV